MSPLSLRLAIKDMRDALARHDAAWAVVPPPEISANERAQVLLLVDGRTIDAACTLLRDLEGLPEQLEAQEARIALLEADKDVDLIAMGNAIGALLQKHGRGGTDGD